MKYIVCCVRDRAIDQFGNPFVVVSTGQAVRTFSDEINKRSEGNQLNAHPEDFDLFTLGEYDTDTGMFDTDVPRQLAVGKDLVVKV